MKDPHVNHLRLWKEKKLLYPVKSPAHGTPLRQWDSRPFFWSSCPLCLQRTLPLGLDGNRHGWIEGNCKGKRKKKKKGRKEKKASRKKEREGERQKLLFHTNLHLKVLRMLKAFIQVGKLRHRRVTFLVQRDRGNQ